MNKESMSVKAIVEAYDLCKVYSVNGFGVEALCSISLTVNEGEFVALVGPSGSGKSTLMHIIGGMESPTRGDVYLGGRSLKQMCEAERTRLRARKVGFVFQTFNLLPTLSAVENVEIALRLGDTPRGEQRHRASELLRLVDLEGKSVHLPRELSGGERQRVAIARALANQPALILADEPTGNLDSRTGGVIVDLLRQLNAQGQTLLLVTHNPEVAEQASRVIEIRDGRIQD